jgi:hypothetical protein
VPVGIFLVLCFLYPLYEILKRSVTERRVGLSNVLEVGVQPPARPDVARFVPEGLHVEVPPDGVLVALARTAGRRGARSGPRRTHSVATPLAGDPPSIALQFEERVWNSPVRLRQGLLPGDVVDPTPADGYVIDGY